VKRALLVYGKRSIKSTGLFDAILAQLANQGISVVEQRGRKAQPRPFPREEGVRIALEAGVDVIVAAGGEV